jgi:peptide-methionine (R)-S-oxide reductase
VAKWNVVTRRKTFFWTEVKTRASDSTVATLTSPATIESPEEEFVVWVAGIDGAKIGSNDKTGTEWKSLLTSHEYAILRQAATDRADQHSEAATSEPKSGLFVCKACYKAKCLTPLYSALAKFKAHCGWPAFDRCFKGAIIERLDVDGVRTEMVCAACTGHLGHVFRDEGYTDADTRHCVNAPSIKFLPKRSRRLFSALSSSADPEATAAIASTPLITHNVLQPKQKTT